MPPLPHTTAYGRTQAEFYSPIVKAAYDQDQEAAPRQEPVPTLPDVVGLLFVYQ